MSISMQEKAPARRASRTPPAKAEAAAMPRLTEAAPRPVLDALAGIQAMIDQYADLAGNGSAALDEGLAYGRELMHSANAYLAAAAELGQALVAARSPQQIMEATTVHARRQLDLLTEQNRQLWMAAQRVVHMAGDGAADED
jgi:hypothetical protein